MFINKYDRNEKTGSSGLKTTATNIGKFSYTYNYIA